MGKGNRGLVVDGGSRPRRRKPDERSWNANKQAIFFETLAGSCNVKMAAIAAGVSPSTVYLRRQNNATFRIGWERALAEGYARLELEMLNRVLHGVEKTVTRAGETTVMRDYNDRVGLALLRMHRDTATIATEAVNDGEYADACDRIVGRIERLREKGLDGDGSLIDAVGRQGQRRMLVAPNTSPSSEGKGSLGGSPGREGGAK